VTAKEEVFLASCFPARHLPTAESIAKLPVGDDGRSEWRWLRTADGDLMLGFFPTGEIYEAVETEVENDYAAALENGTLHEHKLPLSDVLPA
jgi:hypothetical protein